MTLRLFLGVTAGMIWTSLLSAIRHPMSPAISVGGVRVVPGLVAGANSTIIITLSNFPHLAFPLQFT